MNPQDFVHLHVHSDYSHIDGAAKTESLVKAAKKAGHTALALTDHGSVSGAIEFWKACNAEGIKPIIGIEAYLAPGLDELAHTRRGKDEDGKDRIDPKTGKKIPFDYSHFTLLAKNFTGLKNIYRLASEAAINGFYYRPRMSWALIKERHEGIIALSGCLSGEPAEELKKGNDALALQHARRWRGLFGDDYYMELMPAWAPEQAKVNDGCLKIAKDLGAKCVATTDVHYVNPGDADVQEVKICVANHKTLAENRETGLNMKPVFFYKSTDEVAKDFTGYEHVLLTSREIADKVEKIEGKDIVPGKHKQYFMPKFVPPDGSKSLDFFKRIAQAGLIERYGLEGAKLNQARLNFELEVIEKSGFVEYLLIVWDYINWARSNGIPVGPGRGSAAGSLASYCIGITNIDPIRYDLLFERFMNPARVSMPDIDTDVCERGRGRVFEYVKQKYGEECVAQIITFGENKAKSSIRDVARTIGVDVETTNRIARMIPDGPKVELADCMRDIDELKKAGEEDLRVGRVLNLALQLEGFYRNPGRHAAAVVIGDMDLRERIPLTVVGSKGNRGICTAFSMNQVEDVGLVKMDLLGLRTLTQIYDTLDLIESTTRRRLDENRIPVRDSKNMAETANAHICWIHDRPFSQCQCCEKTLRILCEAETNGVFQVESPGMKNLLKQMKPDRFDDLIAICALFRPGPLGTGMDQTYVRRKNGEEPVVYDHPSLEPILKKTYGVMAYQEQVMQLSVTLAGFTMPQADELRKATAKKLPDAMAKIGPNFIKGCVATSGLSEEKATAIWEQISFFSEYSFNCIVGDSVVVCADTGEHRTLKHLAESGERIRVHTLNEDDLGIRSQKIKRVWSTGKREVYEMRTRTNRKITATADHRFYTISGWVQLADLSPGQFVALARHQCVSGAKKPTLKHHEIVVLAGLLSEGNTCHPSTLYFTNKDCPELLREFAECIALFPDTVVRLEEKRGGTLNVVANMGAGAQHRRGERSGAFAWARDLGLTGLSATQKVIPEVAFTLNPADTAKFVGRLWSGDGYVGYTSESVKNKRNPPFFATSSRVMAFQVQELLGRLGIVAVVYEKKFKYRYAPKKRKRRSPTGMTADLGRGRDAKGPYALRGGFAVFMIGLPSVLRFKEVVLPEILGYDLQKKHFNELVDSYDFGSSSDRVPGDVIETALPASASRLRRLGAKKAYLREHLTEIATKSNDSSLLRAASDAVFWDEVVSIKRAGRRETFDMEVEGDHNFAVNSGIIAHNCSHSAAYGLISWWTAWLKANYPIEFFGALMTSSCGSTDTLARYIDEAMRWSIEILPPDINTSSVRFSVVRMPEGSMAISYGLEAVKGVSTEAANAIVSARKRVGRFRSALHFFESVDTDVVGTAAVEALAQAGAFLSTGANRAQLLTPQKYYKGKKVVKEIEETPLKAASLMARRSKKEARTGQGMLFDVPDPQEEAEMLVGTDLMPDIPEWPRRKIAEAEKESMGFYLTTHPLQEYMDVLQEYVSVISKKVRDMRPHARDHVVMGGLVVGMRTIIDKKGNEMAFVSVEDLSGPVDGRIFARTWVEVRRKISIGAVIFMAGELDDESDPPAMRVDRVWTPDEVPKELPRGRSLFMQLGKGSVTEVLKTAILDVLKRNPGDMPVFWAYRGEQELRRCMDQRTSGTHQVRQELRNVLGGRGEVAYE